MPNYFFATDSQTAEDLRNEVLTSTTRKLGMNLRYEFQSSSRRQKGIEEELSRRIRLMEKIPGSHPHEIFVYNHKGFKSFTSQVKDILGRDLLRKPQKGAVPKYLDYTRGMLKDEIEKGKKAQTVSNGVAKGQEEGDDHLKEEYGQLVEEFEAMETEHEQLMEKYTQLKKDHVQLQREHERVLHELSGRKEKETKAPEQKTTCAPDMRPRDEVTKQPPVLDYKSFPPTMHKEARESLQAQEASEQVSALARVKEAREQEEAKSREWEEENFKKEMNKRERELREERAARERQRMRAPPQDLPSKELLDVKAGDAAPQVANHSMHGGVLDPEPTRQTRDQGELLQGQKIGVPNMQQYLPYQPKSAPLRQANDLKSVSFDLPNRTPNMGPVPPTPQRPFQREIVEQQSDSSKSVPFELPKRTANTNQGPPAERNSDPLQQTDIPRSLSAGHPTGTPAMGEIFPAQQPSAQQLPVQRALLPQAPFLRASLPQAPHQQSPVQHFPVQQRSAPLRQARDTASVPYGRPTGTPNMNPLFPVQQRSAPLQQTNESDNVSFCLPITTASTPTDLREPTLPSQRGPQLRVFPRSQEPLGAPEPHNSTTSDQASMEERVDLPDFIRRPHAP